MKEFSHLESLRSKRCRPEDRLPRTRATGHDWQLLTAICILASCAAVADDQPESRVVQTIEWLSRSICTCVVNNAIKNGASPIAISETALQSGMDSCKPDTRMRQMVGGGALPPISNADIGDGGEDTVAKWAPVVAGCSSSMFEASLRDFNIRSAVTNALISARPVQHCVSELYIARKVLSIDTGDCRDENAAASRASGVADVTLSKDGVIAIRFGAEMALVKGKTVELSAQPQSSSKLFWSCTGGDLQPLYRPASCR